MKDKSYIGISFIILIFGIYTVPKVVKYFSKPDLAFFYEDPETKTSKLKVPAFEFKNQKGKTITNQSIKAKCM